MKKKSLKLSTNFTIGATEYASQANAILGIRDSGKTYTAMKAAEELLECGVPIVVFDPVGVWKNLRVGVKGHKGYPIIVAGGDSTSDITLTPDNAVHIVRAAMKARVSIILDLYTPSLANKSKWIKIVQEVVDMLFLENRDHGLMHVFLEEASEFIPQRVMPNVAKVYGSLERLARMGRNSSIGMTIINQRAEEINKAIFELCACVFLHKQVGKNSLLSISKWLEVSGLNTSNTGQKAVAATQWLPNLKQGECVPISTDTKDSSYIKVIKILPKNTYHPSPQKGVQKQSKKSTVNISSFIKRLNEQLKPKEEKKKDTKSSTEVSMKTYIAPSQAVKDRDTAIAQLNRSNQEQNKQLALALEEIESLRQIIDEMQTNARVSGIHINKIINTNVLKRRVRMKPILKPNNPGNSGPVLGKAEKPTGQPGQGNEATDRGNSYTGRVRASGQDLPAKHRMLKGVTMFPAGIGKPALAVLCGMSPDSGTFGVYHRQLRAEGLIQEVNGVFIPTMEGNKAAADYPTLATSTKELLMQWYDILGRDSGLSRILSVVAEAEGDWVHIGEVAHKANLESSSGTFGVYQRKLRKYGLIETNKREFKLSSNAILS